MTCGPVQRLILAGIMLRTERVGGADMRAVEGLTKQSSEILGFAQFDQSAEGSIRIGRRRVDQKTGLVFLAIDLGVYPFPNAGSIIAAFQGQLSDEHMRHGMKHDVARSGIALPRVEIPLLTPSMMTHA